MESYSSNKDWLIFTECFHGVSNYAHIWNQSHAFTATLIEFHVNFWKEKKIHKTLFLKIHKSAHEDLVKCERYKIVFALDNPFLPLIESD